MVDAALRERIERGVGVFEEAMRLTELGLIRVLI